MQRVALGVGRSGKDSIDHMPGAHDDLAKCGGGCGGHIPHAELLKSVARRIVDRRVLHLIKMWLECCQADCQARLPP